MFLLVFMRRLLASVIMCVCVCTSTERKKSNQMFTNEYLIILHLPTSEE